MGKIELCYLHRDTLTLFERFTFILFFSNLLRKQFCLFFGCARSSVLCGLFSSCWWARATLWLWCQGFSLWWLLLLRSSGSNCEGSVVVTHVFSCSKAYGIFPDQERNRCPLGCKADSWPLDHLGSPLLSILTNHIVLIKPTTLSLHSTIAHFPFPLPFGYFFYH